MKTKEGVVCPMKVLLISGGHVDPSFAAGFLQEHTFQKVIAVDGGLGIARRLKASPLPEIVGDFDTVQPEVLAVYTREAQNGQGPVIHKYNPEKDYTDTDIALKLAMEYCEGQAESQIWILGATGTRLDHVLANISMLLLPLRKGIRAVIQDENNRISLLSGQLTIEKHSHFGKYLSLIPLTPEISGLTLRGVKYPLEDHRVLQGESSCVSNEITQAQAFLKVEKGIAILLETRD